MVGMAIRWLLSAAVLGCAGCGWQAPDAALLSELSQWAGKVEVIELAADGTPIAPPRLQGELSFARATGLVQWTERTPDHADSFVRLPDGGGTRLFRNGVPDVPTPAEQERFALVLALVDPPADSPAGAGDPVLQSRDSKGYVVRVAERTLRVTWRVEVPVGAHGGGP